MIVNTGLNRTKSGILQRLPDFLLPILVTEAAKSGCKVCDRGQGQDDGVHADWRDGDEGIEM